MNPDILFICETWCSDEETHTTKNFLPSYNFVSVEATRINTKGRKSGGLLLGIKSGIKVVQISTTKSSIKLDLDDFSLLSCYFPPNEQGDSYFNDFCESIAELTINTPNLIIIGDLNARTGEIPNLSDTNSEMKRECRDKTRRFTFTNANGASSPDICLVSNNILHQIINFNVNDCLSAYHHPIQLEINNNSASPLPTFTSVKGISTSTIIRVKWDPFLTYKFTTCLPPTNDSNPYTTFISNVVQSLTVCEMIKDIKISPSTKITKASWFDTECKLLKHQARSSLRTYRKDPTDELRQIYLSRRNSYVKYKFWETVKKLRPRVITSSPVTPTSWIDHFSSLFKEKSAHTQITGHPRQTYSDDDVSSPITYDELNSALKQIKPKKAPGHDGIPSDVWKELTSAYISNLTACFNKILEDGSIPDEWSVILLQPVFKKGDKNEPSNYRPIALAATILKLFTSILTKRLQAWSDNNNKIAPEQAGFRKGMGTLEHVFSLLTLIQSRIRKPGGKLFAAFIDLKSAFDSPSHTKLWSVLSEQGVSPKIIRVLRNLYSKAKGQVKTPFGITDPFPMEKGVFQGEPSSSLCFNLFINELVTLLEKNQFPVTMGDAKIHLLLYCDDICIIADSAHALQQKINIAANFFKARGLQVNISKTKVMIFAKRKSKKMWNSTKITWDGAELEIVMKYTYLGVTFHSNLAFSKTAQDFRQKANVALSKIWDICKKTKVPPMETHLKLYNAIVQSTLLYAVPVWGWGQEKILEKVQSKFLKTLLRLPPSAPNYFLRQETNMPPIQIPIMKSTLAFWIRTLKRPPSSLPYICLMEQLKWSKQANKFKTWSSLPLNMFKLAGFSDVSILKDVTQLTNLKTDIVTNLREHFLQADEKRMQVSSFIPLYQYIRTCPDKPSYLSGTFSMPIAQLMAQLRLNRFSIKLGSWDQISLSPIWRKIMLNATNNLEAAESMFEKLHPQRVAYQFECIFDAESNAANGFDLRGPRDLPVTVGFKYGLFVMSHINSNVFLTLNPMPPMVLISEAPVTFP
ncbi:RNA-directed DNA polymerase from mobile element jockey [Folsomia candida]|uniref:RNA-directed DNA polymerase from mobile element jockey n=1 Tax=Folsomia candida TaxID=158441 RepID=A0A226EEM0_FOLCA|nr:RNA-directed DNA polymerase from mobile element jockey [Folsomia candida]